MLELVSRLSQLTMAWVHETISRPVQGRGMDRDDDGVRWSKGEAGGVVAWVLARSRWRSNVRLRTIAVNVSGQLATSLTLWHYM